MNSEADFAACAGCEGAAAVQDGGCSSTASSGSSGSWASMRSAAASSKQQHADQQQADRLQPLSDDGDGHRAAACTSRSCGGGSLRHRRPARRRAAAPVPLLAAAVALAVLLGGPSGAAAKLCTRYRGSGCHFTSRHGEPVVFPACTTACRFQVEQELKCPFHSAGLFATQEAEECGDNFLEVEPRELPDCSQHCCRAQRTTGSFLRKPIAGHPQRLQFQPGGERSCRYEQYSRAEVLEALQGGDAAAGDHPGMDILVMGDSLMRQAFSRLVHMMRGHNRVVDYKMHTHASYSICQEADAFQTALYNGNRTTLGARTDADYMLDIVPKFFQGGNNVEPGMLCSKRPAAIHFANAPRWRDQLATLERYWPAVTPGRHPVLVLSVGFWEKAAEVPPEYLAALTEAAAKVERVFFVGVPTARVANEQWRTAYAARNRAMAAWAAAAGPRAEYIDFDRLSRTPGGPAGGAEGNWHYQCFLQWPSWRVKKPRSTLNYFRDRVYGHPIEGIVMTEDGHCTDEMNRNIWQLIFNVLLGQRGQPASPEDLARGSQTSGSDGGGFAAADSFTAARRMLRRLAM